MRASASLLFCVSLDPQGKLYYPKVSHSEIIILSVKYHLAKSFVQVCVKVFEPSITLQELRNSSDSDGSHTMCFKCLDMCTMDSRCDLCVSLHEKEFCGLLDANILQLQDIGGLLEAWNPSNPGSSHSKILSRTRSKKFSSKKDISMSSQKSYHKSVQEQSVESSQRCRGIKNTLMLRKSQNFALQSHFFQKKMFVMMTTWTCTPQGGGGPLW